MSIKTKKIDIFTKYIYTIDIESEPVYKTKKSKLYSYELADLIFEQPYSRINNLVERDIAKRQTASVYLKQLCEIDVLLETEEGREKLFIHTKLLKLLTNENNLLYAYPN